MNDKNYSYFKFDYSGFVLGMRHVFVDQSRKKEIALCPSIVGPTNASTKCKQPHLVDEVREKVFMDPKNTREFWSKKGQELMVDILFTQ